MERIGQITDEVLQAIWTLAEQTLRTLPVEILHMEWGVESGKRILRVYVERRDAALVSVSDCVQASRALEAVLDGNESMDSDYTLEVSSPGVNRPLVRLKDFENSQGKVVHIESRVPIEGRKRFHGRLVALVKDQVDLTVDGKVFHIPLTCIKKASLDFFASEGT